MIDSQSRAPIEGVRVHRIGAGGNTQVGSPTHGGESMEDAPVVVETRADGSFAIDSERDIALFRKVNWYSVSIAFEHPSYASLTTTYTPSNTVNSASGEPVVKAGDVVMVRSQ